MAVRITTWPPTPPHDLPRHRGAASGENVTGGLGLFFPHMSARIVMHSVVVQAHVRKTYWDELADLPTQIINLNIWEE